MIAKRKSGVTAVLVFLLGLSLFVVGCSDDETTIFVTPTAGPATETPLPTETSEISPTSTPEATATAVPTDTPGQTQPPVTATPTGPPTETPTQATPPPNIVFIILDDVGIDQVEVFGLGEGNLGATPNLTAIANAGVRFSNAWSMPECSPSRATIFTGRFPLRHGVTSALIPNMLPQAQVSPYETTLPRVLAEAGYSSAMVGKYHLGNRNPAGNCSPQTTGFDFFDGNMEAGPPSIDRQAGHAEDGAAADFSCGFQTETFVGNCYFEDGSCSAELVDVPNAEGGTEPAPVSGRHCMEAGGIFVKESVGCQETSPVGCPDTSHASCLELGDGSAILDFDRPNGYYAWPETTLSGVLSPDTTEFPDPQCGEPPTSRTYMTIAQTDRSIDWYQEQTGPRMLTVSYNSIHTPYQPAPNALASLVAAPELMCGELPSDRILGNNMLESMDREIGRLLESLGLATLDDDGVIQTVVDDDGFAQIPELAAANTMVAVVGDNGTFFEVVKPPFDALRSKGSVYETGVLVPLMVSGPLVQGPTGRENNDLISIADLFGLFADIGGVDLNEAVPPAHVLDSVPMLPYLTDPDQESIREFNFTQLGPGVFESPVNPETRSWPCVLRIAGANVCNEVLFDTQDFCNTNSGVWWGPTDNPEAEVVAILGDAAGQGLPSCCQIEAAFAGAGMAEPIIAPLEQFSVRNRTYKLIRFSFPDCDSEDGSFPPANRRESFELYDLAAVTVTNPLALDFGSENLICAERTLGTGATCRDGSACDLEDPTACLNDEQMDNFTALQAELDRIIASEPTCEGDGNLDFRVDQRDADGVTAFSQATSPLTGAAGGQSFFDLNGDAVTDEADGQVVSANLGTDCIGACRRSDLNRDGYVDDEDVAVLAGMIGPCELCGGDLNGDGTVDPVDLQVLEGQRGCSTPTPSPTPVSTGPIPTRTVAPPFFCNQTCLPDATDRQCGCDLFVPGETSIPAEAGIDCGLVCEQYATCQRTTIEVGFTCDATLCTTSSQALALEACYGIQACEIGEILRAELAAGCSCCASQLCGCEATAATDASVFFLDALQRSRGDVPQCDINGTLCGE